MSWEDNFFYDLLCIEIGPLLAIMHMWRTFMVILIWVVAWPSYHNFFHFIIYIRYTPTNMLYVRNTTKGAFTHNEIRPDFILKNIGHY